MTHQTRFSAYTVFGALFLAALVVGVVLPLRAAAQPNVSYPVMELGGCENKNACKAYCNDPANVSACVDFAKAHGLIKNDAAERAKKFARSLQGGEGPGGCASPDACAAYCGDTAHLEECVAFADEHGVKLPKDDPGRKILAYLKAGGTMPGGCASRESCEAYCRGEANRNECVAFAEKAGIMKAENAERLRELGGKGPGGCASRESCEAYCRTDNHREECYRFAEEHDLLSEEGIEHAKEGLLRLRAGLENAPEEVAACVRAALGTDVVERIMRGEFTPGPEVGEKLKGCFERFGQDKNPRELFRDAPADVVSCLKEKLGDRYDAVRSGGEPPTPEMADTLRVCFAKKQFMRQESGPFMSADAGESSAGASPQDFLQNAPPGIRECVARKLGTTTLPRTSEMTAELKEKLRDCFETFKPAGARSAEGEPSTEKPQGVDRELAECLARAKDEARSSLQGATGTAPYGGLLSELNRKCYAEFGPGNGQRNSVPDGSGTQGAKPLPQPVGPPAMAPEAVQCLRARVDASTFEELMRGSVPGPEVEAKIRECLNSFLKDRTGGMPDEPADCPQRLTQAQDPMSGACKTFPSPCGVPRGWRLGCSAPAGAGTAPYGFPPAPPSGVDMNMSPSSAGPLQNATAQVSRNPFEIFVRFLLGF